MNCLKCNKQLEGQQKKYCSIYCSKLYLKSLYRKRKRDELNEYKRKRRSDGKEKKSQYRDSRKIKKLKEGGKCRACNSLENLTVNHIVPLAIGGGNEDSNLEILCVTCNSKEYHQLIQKALKVYFAKYLKYKEMLK